jgi:sugar phosphate isomerase/epimerase
MYRNLNPGSLGIYCRQNELIELALTYKFAGIDIDMESFARQVELRGIDHAARFVRSANIRIGTFELPLAWQSDAETFERELRKLGPVCEAAEALGAKDCVTTVLPYSDDRRYHENFEFHRQRLSQIADTMSGYGIRLGLGFQAASCHREGHAEPFITTASALVTLMKTIVAKNVGICLDLWNWHIGGGTVEQIREIPANKIVAVRLADIPRDVSLDRLTEEDRLLPTTTGLVPCTTAIATLCDIGYEGSVTVYGHPSRFANQARNRIASDVAKSLDRVFGLSYEPLEAPSIASEIEEPEAAAAS